MTDVACSTTVSATGPAEISSSAAPDEAAQLARARREAIKLEKRLCRLAGQAIVDYNMIEAGDRVMVCVSGGKDSQAAAMATFQFLKI